MEEEERGAGSSNSYDGVDAEASDAGGGGGGEVLPQQQLRLQWTLFWKKNSATKKRRHGYSSNSTLRTKRTTATK